MNVSAIRVSRDLGDSVRFLAIVCCFQLLVPRGFGSEPGDSGSGGMGYLNSVLQQSSKLVHAADDSPVSGGGLSQNGKFSYGYASSPGKRASMEDFYETRINGIDGEIVGLFGVFDDISRAILNVTEELKMLEIEERWFHRTNSWQDSSVTSVTSNSNSLTLGSFWGLFLIAGVASLLALLVSIAIFLKRNWYISSGDSFKEKMVDLSSRFFQKDVTSHTFRQLGTSQDGIAENRVRESRNDIVSDNSNCPHSLASYSTETEDAPGQQGTQAAVRDIHANSTEGRVSTEVVIDIELVASVNHENT